MLLSPHDTFPISSNLSYFCLMDQMVWHMGPILSSSSILVSCSLWPLTLECSPIASIYYQSYVNFLQDLYNSTSGLIFIQFLSLVTLFSLDLLIFPPLLLPIMTTCVFSFHCLSPCYVVSYSPLTMYKIM